MIVYDMYRQILRALVRSLAFVSGIGILVMMSITCVDVVLRYFYRPITGSVDIVCIASTLTIVCGLPYTTAVKGHVAIEFFFHKLPWIARVAVDTIVRVIGIVLFGLLSYHSYRYGMVLQAANQVSSTLQIPLFWVPWMISGSCGVTSLVILHNLLHPGRELIKP